jgi:hypothetical protein
MTKSHDEPPSSPLSATSINDLIRRTLARSPALSREGRWLAENDRAAGDGRQGSRQELRATVCAVITLALESVHEDGEDEPRTCGPTLPSPSRRPPGEDDDEGATN